MEEWRWVQGYEGLYEVSSQGRIRSYQPSRKRPHIPHFIQPRLDHKGYLVLFLHRDGKAKGRKVHRLIAETFVPRSDSTLHVNHIDGVKTNNGAANLEWVTQSQNSRLAWEMGLIKKPPSVKGRRKLSPELLPDLWALFNAGLTRKDIALKLGFPVSTIQHAMKGSRRAGC